MGFVFFSCKKFDIGFFFLILLSIRLMSNLLSRVQVDDDDDQYFNGLDDSDCESDDSNGNVNHLFQCL